MEDSVDLLVVPLTQPDLLISGMKESDQPELGILLISPKNIYFFKEKPDKW